MNRRTNNERLLEDVLAEDAGPKSQTDTLDQLLHLARRKRRARQIRGWGSLVGLLIILMSVFVLPVGKRKPTVSLANGSRQPKSYELVNSVALRPEQIITSSALPPGQIVSSGMKIEIVQTTSNGFHLVGDEELLELARPQIAALVRRGPHEVELVFITPPAAAQAN